MPENTDQPSPPPDPAVIWYDGILRSMIQQGAQLVQPDQPAQRPVGWVYHTADYRRNLLEIFNNATPVQPAPPTPAPVQNTVAPSDQGLISSEPQGYETVEWTIPTAHISEWRCPWSDEEDEEPAAANAAPINSMYKLGDIIRVKESSVAKFKQMLPDFPGVFMLVKDDSLWSPVVSANGETHRLNNLGLQREDTELVKRFDIDPAVRVVREVVALRQGVDPELALCNGENDSGNVRAFTDKWSEFTVSSTRSTGFSVVYTEGIEFFVPTCLLVPVVAGSRTAQMNKVLARPITSKEQRTLDKKRFLLRHVAQHMSADVRAVTERYLMCLRGLPIWRRHSRWPDLADNFRYMKRRMCSPANVEHFGDVIDRFHRTLRRAPAEWPRWADAPGHMIGVELEYVVPVARTDFGCEDIPPINPPLGLHVTTDGSVKTHSTGFSANHDTEARMAFKFGDWNRLNKSCKALLDRGCVANISCGLHVHLDMRGRDIDQVRAVARRLAASLPFLNTLVPKSRWDGPHAERYCRQGYSFEDRYFAINGCSFSKFETLEVRLHSGSLNPTKIRRWVEILHYLAHRDGNFIRTFEQWISSDAPYELKEYSIRRRSQLYPLETPDVLGPPELSEVTI